MDTFAVIINAAAGAQATKQKVAALRDAFAANGVTPEFFLAHDGAAIGASAKKALDKGYRMITAAGGDGTVNAVASRLINTSAILGVLPMGTLNHFAKDLGIPLALEEAVPVLLNGLERFVDAAQVNKNIFLNNSGLGIYPKLVRYREEQQRSGRRKWLAFCMALLNAFKRHAFLKVELKVNGRQVNYKTPFVFIGNNQYEVEGLSIGSRAHLDSGLLSVYIIRGSGRLGFILMIWRAFMGNLRDHKDFDEYASSEVSIDVSRNFLKVAIDGEVMVLPSPLEYKIIPRALKVMAPRP